MSTVQIDIADYARFIQMQEENAKLREQIYQLQQREEAKLKALDEQEPEGYQFLSNPKVFYHKDWKPTDINNFRKLYSKPVPPVDVQELQKQLDKKNRTIKCRNDDLNEQAIRIAALERKLAQYQSYIVADGDDERELNTLIAQAREEGYQLGQQNPVASDGAVRIGTWDVEFIDDKEESKS